MATAKKTSKKTVCVVTGCGRPVQTRGVDARRAELEGLCRKHNLEAQKAGSAAFRPTP